MSEVTRILQSMEEGDAKAAEELLPLVYQELRKLAAARMAQQPPGQTLQATALVHEAYLKLVGGVRENWRDRQHFFRAAAEAMRHILIDRARRRPVALGHLLEAKYLSMPANNNHVFYCPSMEASGGMKPGPFGFVYASDRREELWSQRGFDGWGEPRIVNIGYDYRVSLSETESVNLKEVTTYRKLAEVGNLALAADAISWGAGRFAHRNRHHFVRGDGGVSVFLDKGSPPVWEEFGLDPGQNSDVMFLALDHPLDFRSLLRR